MPVERMPVKAHGTAVSLLLPILGLALLASLSPATIIVFILVLATTRAHVNALAFLVGWGASLTVVFAVAYTMGGLTPPNTAAGALGWNSSRLPSVWCWPWRAGSGGSDATHLDLAREPPRPSPTASLSCTRRRRRSWG